MMFILLSSFTVYSTFVLVAFAVSHNLEGKKGLDIDLNKSPPASPQSFNQPISTLKKDDLLVSLKNDKQPNLIGVRVEYDFPVGTTTKEKKQMYNKIQYIRKVSKME